MEFQFMQHGYITKYFLQPSKDIKTIPNIWSVLKHDRPHLVLGTVACWFLQPAHEQVSLQNCFREAGVCAALSCCALLPPVSEELEQTPFSGCIERLCQFENQHRQLCGCHPVSAPWSPIFRTRNSLAHLHKLHPPTQICLTDVLAYEILSLFGSEFGQ